MTQKTVFHLEKFPAFLERVVRLHAVYAPDDPLHAFLLDEEASGDAEDLARAAATRKALRALHDGFPTGVPVHEQAAYLVRGFAALRPFDEANQRTGWDYTEELLMHHGFEPTTSIDEVRDLQARVWEDVEARWPAGIPEDHLAVRDDLWVGLAEWFHDHIAGHD